MITNIYDQLRRDEGTRLTKYRDTRGFWTIGTGHNLDANPLSFDISKGITDSQASQILVGDVAHITFQLIKDIPWIVSLGSTDAVRFGVFQNMAFNMGAGGVVKFHHTLSDSQAGNWVKVGADMKASAWYTQVGARAERLVEQILTGTWQ